MLKNKHLKTHTDATYKTNKKQRQQQRNEQQQYFFHMNVKEDNNKKCIQSKYVTC